MRDFSYRLTKPGVIVYLTVYRSLILPAVIYTCRSLFGQVDRGALYPGPAHSVALSITSVVLRAPMRNCAKGPGTAVHRCRSVDTKCAHVYNLYRHTDRRTRLRRRSVEAVAKAKPGSLLRWRDRFVEKVCSREEAPLGTINTAERNEQRCTAEGQARARSRHAKTSPGENSPSLLTLGGAHIFGDKQMLGPRSRAKGRATAQRRFPRVH